MPPLTYRIAVDNRRRAPSAKHPAVHSRQLRRISSLPKQRTLTRCLYEAGAVGLAAHVSNDMREENFAHKPCPRNRSAGYTSAPAFSASSRTTIVAYGTRPEAPLAPRMGRANCGRSRDRARQFGPAGINSPLAHAINSSPAPNVHQQRLCAAKIVLAVKNQSPRSRPRGRRSSVSNERTSWLSGHRWKIRKARRTRGLFFESMRTHLEPPR